MMHLGSCSKALAAGHHGDVIDIKNFIGVTAQDLDPGVS